MATVAAATHVSDTSRRVEDDGDEEDGGGGRHLEHAVAAASIPATPARPTVAAACTSRRLRGSGTVVIAKRRARSDLLPCRVS